MKPIPCVLSIAALIFIPLISPAAVAQTCPSPLPADYTQGQCIWSLDMVNVCDSDPDLHHRCDGTGAVRCVAETGVGVNIAVLDSGLIPDWRNYLPEAQIDTDHARSFLDPNMHVGSTLEWFDSGWVHGTVISSIITGSHTILPEYPYWELCLQGMAPRAKIVPIRVTADDRSGEASETIAAIEYVIGLVTSGEFQGRTVISFSGTMLPDDPDLAAQNAAFEAAIQHGIVVVAGAGSCGPSAILCDDYRGMTYPGADPLVISVGSTGWVDNLTDPLWPALDVRENPNETYVAGWSGRANVDAGQELDVMAPGSWVFDPVTGYFRTGSSFATPHAAGAAALLLEKDPTLTPAEIEHLLKSTASPIPPGDGYLDPLLFLGPPAPWGNQSWEQGGGLLQADKALKEVKKAP